METALSGPAQTLEKVKDKINAAFPGSLVSADLPYDLPTFTISHEKVHDVLKMVKEDEDINLHFLTDLTGMQTADEKHLGVIYHLHNMQKNFRVRIKSFVDIHKPEFPTATDLWPSANWMERETWDFFGIKFVGHPNLKRILNVDEMDIFPLRKEFPLEDQTKDDKEDYKFGR
jgi:NADH-quinone oxidoreductase subunit C